MFYYEKVLGKDLQFIQRIRAKASTYLPVVLSKREISELLCRTTTPPSRKQFCNCDAKGAA